MAFPVFFWPASGAVARSVALVPFRDGLAAADCTAPVLWPFNGNTFTAPVVLASGTPGLSAAAADAASGVWTVGFSGPLWHQPAAGAAVASALPAGAVYTGCAVLGGQPYVMTAQSTVLTSAGVQVGGWPFGAAVGFAGSGSVLAALLPTLGLSTMTTAGVTGAIVPLPAGITVAACLSFVSGTPVAVAGWQTAPALSGAAAAALSPTDPTAMLAVGSGRAVLWRAPDGLSDAWSQTRLLTGLAGLTALGWTPDGFHALACSPASGLVQVINYATGALSLGQALTVSGAAAVAVAGDSLHAVVAQSGQSQLATLVNTGTWAAGAAVTGLPGITTVIPYGVSGAVAAYGSGLAWLTLATGGWSITGRLALGYGPSVLTQDPFGTLYAAGSGVLSVVSAASAVVGSGAWAGAAPAGIGVQQGRVLLTVPSDTLLYDFGQAPGGAWTAQSTTALSAGTVGLGLAQSTLFVLGTAGTVTYGFSGTPFALTAPVSGTVAQRSGAAWIVTGLGVGHTPAAIRYDGSGNLRVACTQNTLWTINQSGTVLASGSLLQYDVQPQAVPLGVSALLALSSGVYAATSLSGTLVQVA